MSVYCCPACGHAEPIFGSGGGAKIAAQYGVELLSQLPLDARIREEADNGVPTVVAEPDSPLTAIYRELARKTAGRLSRQSRNKAIAFPQIVIQQS